MQSDSIRGKVFNKLLRVNASKNQRLSEKSRTWSKIDLAHFCLQFKPYMVNKRKWGQNFEIRVLTGINR